MNITPLKNKVRVHTAVNKDIYTKIVKMSETSGMPKEVIVNTLLTRGLARTKAK
jgi:hypothetical protein